MRQVMFSTRCAWGRLALVRANIFQTWVARGSCLASFSGSVSEDGRGMDRTSGEPDGLGEAKVFGVGSLAEALKRSSEKRSDRMADFFESREADVEGEGWM